LKNKVVIEQEKKLSELSCQYNRKMNALFLSLYEKRKIPKENVCECFTFYLNVDECPISYNVPLFSISTDSTTTKMCRIYIFTYLARCKHK
jgi:hypothetical protein